MSEPRKDIKAVKVDAAVHEAMLQICSRDGININTLAERAIEKFVADEIHKYTISHRYFASLRIVANLREKP